MDNIFSFLTKDMKRLRTYLKVDKLPENKQININTNAIKKLHLLASMRLAEQLTITNL